MKTDFTTNPNDRKFVDILEPTAFLLAREAILSVDNTLSIIKLYDDLIYTPDVKPPFLPPLFVVVEFLRNKHVPVDEYNNLNLKYRIRMEPPSGHTVELVEFPVDKVDKPWSYSRTVLDFTQYVGFLGYGDYFFTLAGVVANGEYEYLSKRVISIKQAPIHGEAADNVLVTLPN